MTAARQSWRWHLGICAALCIAAMLTYFLVVRGEFFAFDDDVEVLLNEHIRSFSADNLRWMFTDTVLTQRYTPFSWIAWAIVYQFGGLNPAAYHLHALVVHAGNSLLAYFLILAVLLRLPGSGLRQQYVWLAAGMSAALWALHPMRAEVVGCVTQVRYGEAAGCAMGAILCYLRAPREAAKPLWRSGWYWGAIGLYAASVLFYPSAIALPVLLLLMDALPLGRQDRGWPYWRQSLLETTPMFAVAFVVGAMTLYGRVTSAHIWGAPASVASFGILERVLQAAFVFNFYLVKPFLLFYNAPSPIAEAQLIAPAYIAGLLVVIGMTGAAVALRKRHPGIAILWAAHLLALFPFRGYFERPYHTWDRYAYIHDLIFAIAVAYGFLRLMAMPRVTAAIRFAVTGATVAALAALAVLGRAQAATWHDSITTMRYILAQVGNDPYQRYFHWALGKAYFDHGRYAEAVDACDRTLRELPAHSEALQVMVDSLLALAREAEGTDAAAASAYRARAGAAMDAAYHAKPKPQFLVVAGLMYQQAGRITEALERFEAAVQAAPADSTVRLILGEALSRAGRPAEARTQLERAVALDPRLAPMQEKLLRDWAALAPQPTGNH